MFTFKRFSIDDSNCSMKVGTDGVLLGAWADVKNAEHILDIGCGSGLVSLMVAQRNPNAQVVGVEIDAAAASNARANVEASPFSKQIQIICADVMAFLHSPSRMIEEENAVNTTTVKNGKQSFQHFFDSIVTNPPFYQEDLLPPSSSRAIASHTSGGGLTFEALLHAASFFLKEEMKIANEESKQSIPYNSPRFSLILPTQSVKRFEGVANLYGFFISRLTTVVTRMGKPSKRTLLELKKKEMQKKTDTLLLLDSLGNRTSQYSNLCQDFYL